MLIELYLREGLQRTLREPQCPKLKTMAEALEVTPN